MSVRADTMKIIKTCPLEWTSAFLIGYPLGYSNGGTVARLMKASGAFDTRLNSYGTMLEYRLNEKGLALRTPTPTPGGRCG